MSTVDVLDDQKDGASFAHDNPQNENENQKSAIGSEDENFEDPANDAGPGNSIPGDNQENDSVIDIPKHKLQYRWVLWYCKPERGAKWEDCMKEVIGFETVEDFWAMYNHIQVASGLSIGSDYYMFKEGIQPMWEDPQNCQGGRWLVTVERNRREQVLDSYWLELLLAMVGEQFDDFGDFISGAVVNIRQKGDKVSLWTRDANREDVNRRIGQILKQKLNIAETITYELHQDTKQKNSSMVKPHLRI